MVGKTLNQRLSIPNRGMTLAGPMKKYVDEIRQCWQHTLFSEKSFLEIGGGSGTLSDEKNVAKMTPHPVPGRIIRQK
jgi:hypothetical protein